MKNNCCDDRGQDRQVFPSVLLNEPRYAFVHVCSLLLQGDVTRYDGDK